MIQISKNERMYLESKGFRFGSYLFRSHSKHPKYYAVESPKLLRELKKYKDGLLINSYGG